MVISRTQCWPRPMKQCISSKSHRMCTLWSVSCTVSASPTHRLAGLEHLAQACQLWHRLEQGSVLVGDGLACERGGGDCAAGGGGRARRGGQAGGGSPPGIGRRLGHDGLHNTQRECGDFDVPRALWFSEHAQQVPSASTMACTTHNEACFAESASVRFTLRLCAFE